MAAMTSEPILTILDRWPDEELQQHRTKPTAAVEEAINDEHQNNHHGDHHFHGAIGRAD